jgi:hypothetical protein
MVEEYSVAAKHPVGFAVVYGQMKPGDLADAVWTAWAKRCGFGLWDLQHFAEHFTGTRKVEFAFRPQFLKCSQDIVRPVDVSIHGAKAIGETFGNETLRSKVVAFVEIVATEYVKDTRIAFQICRMKSQTIQYVMDSPESPLWLFHRHPSHQAVDFIPLIQQVLGKIASVLTRNTRY